jgi:hypothetical protein
MEIFSLTFFLFFKLRYVTSAGRFAVFRAMACANNMDTDHHGIDDAKYVTSVVTECCGD